MTRFTRRNWRAPCAPLLAVVLALSSGCDSGTTAPVVEPPRPVKASDWVASVDWNTATVVHVTMSEVSPTRFVFQPSTLTFEAGKPYILRLTSPSLNVAKHYLSPRGAGSFYKAIATRKLQTSYAEYKAPYFDEVELLVGGTAELYFVPVLPGTYEIVCALPMETRTPEDGSPYVGWIADLLAGMQSWPRVRALRSAA